MSEANAEVIMDRVLNLAARYSTNTLNPKIVQRLRQEQQVAALP